MGDAWEGDGSSLSRTVWPWKRAVSRPLITTGRAQCDAYLSANMHGSRSSRHPATLVDLQFVWHDSRQSRRGCLESRNDYIMLFKPT